MGLGGDGGVLRHNHVKPNSVALSCDCFEVELGLRQNSVIIMQILYKYCRKRVDQILSNNMQILCKDCTNILQILCKFHEEILKSCESVQYM